EQDRLLLQCPLQLAGITVELRIRSDVPPQFARSQPLLDKTLDRFPRLPVLQHPPNLLAQRFRLVQLPFRRHAQQLLVGHAGPQEIRQPRCDLVRSDQPRLGRRVGLLHSKQKMRRDEYAPQGQQDRLVEWLTALLSRFEEIEIALDVTFTRWPPKSSRNESLDNRLRCFRRSRRIGLRWRIASPKAGPLLLRRRAG